MAAGGVAEEASRQGLEREEQLEVFHQDMAFGDVKLL